MVVGGRRVGVAQEPVPLIAEGSLPVQLDRRRAPPGLEAVAQSEDRIPEPGLGGQLVGPVAQLARDTHDRQLEDEVELRFPTQLRVPGDGALLPEAAPRKKRPAPILRVVRVGREPTAVDLAVELAGCQVPRAGGSRGARGDKGNRNREDEPTLAHAHERQWCLHGTVNPGSERERVSASPRWIKGLLDPSRGAAAARPGRASPRPARYGTMPDPWKSSASWSSSATPTPCGTCLARWWTSCAGAFRTWSSMRRPTWRKPSATSPRPTSCSDGR